MNGVRADSDPNGPVKPEGSTPGEPPRVLTVHFSASIMEPIWNHSKRSMPNLSIKNVPPEVVGKLRERAAANHRSLQGELMDLVTRAVSGSADAVEHLATRRSRRGHKSIEQIAAEHRARVKRPIRKGGRAVEMIRADRDAR